jgi:hypothetical protein
LVLSTNPVPTAEPRPPQPKIPRRTAEFAAEPRTAPGFTIITPAAVAAAAPRNLLRLTFSFEPSAMNIPPCFFTKAMIEVVMIVAIRARNPAKHF